MYSDQHLTEMIIPFYLNEKPDLNGRMIHQIWAWDLEELECCHDYIQWLFPIPEKSHFNLDAPVVDEQVVQLFQQNVILRRNLLRSFSIILDLYGLKKSEDKHQNIIITKGKDYLVRKREWVNLFDHNYLRITRILKCLVTFGLEKEAQSFYKCLSQIYQEDSDQIGSETFQYWTDAVTHLYSL